MLRVLNTIIAWRDRRLILLGKVFENQQFTLDTNWDNETSKVLCWLSEMISIDTLDEIPWASQLLLSLELKMFLKQGQSR